MTPFACRVCIGAALFALFAGCINVKIIHGDDADVVAVENEGYFLFQCVPLVAGNPDNPNKNSFRLFSNTLSVNTNISLLMGEISRKGAKDVSDIATFTTDESVIPVLFSRRTIQTSARLVW